MPVRRLLGIILLATATSVSLVAPAAAAPYGPHAGSATVSKTTVVQGSAVTVRGDAFCSGAAVTVTVTQNGDTYIRKTIHAGSAGGVATSVTLSHLGLNHLKLSGCYAGGGGPTTQNLTAAVQVVPHGGKVHVSDHTVNKGDTVTVSAKGFCKKASVKVRVYDDGHRYQAKLIKANKHGKATTSVKLTRKGRTTITLEGCRKAGGTQLKSVTVKVRKAQSFSGSSAAYLGGLAGNAKPASFVVAGGALLLLFGAGQLMFARRRRSSGTTIEPNG
jgi:hypothetical protein